MLILCAIGTHWPLVHHVLGTDDRGKREPSLTSWVFLLADKMQRHLTNNYTPVYEAGTLGEFYPESFYFHWETRGKVICSERQGNWESGLTLRIIVSQVSFPHHFGGTGVWTQGLQLVS
jgi:hypothetical protein